jgi:hypothetical protein
MNIKVLTAGTVLLLSALLLGCAVSARTTEGSFPFGTKGASPGPRIVLDRLAGGDERVNGSGRLVTEDFDIRGFSRVDISHAFRVELVQSSSYKVVVRVDENLQQHLRIEKRGETLVIGLKPYRSYNLRNATMEAEVHLPDLRGIEASGASDVRISGFSSARDFDVDLSGASYLDGSGGPHRGLRGQPGSSAGQSGGSAPGCVRGQQPGSGGFSGAKCRHRAQRSERSRGGVERNP